jgi:hypothetical protein
MSASNYYRLLQENRFRVHPLRYPMMGLVGGCSVVNSVLNRCQRLQFEGRISKAQLAAPPVFIIGHWRSGTTLMHELMSLDPAAAYPTNFDAFVPKHFLFSNWFFFPLVSLLLPKKRPMDSMAISAGSPQEDDFALISDGAATPYRRIAFPNNEDKHHQQLCFDHADQQQQQSVRQTLDHFLKSLTIRYPNKRLVLKSPPHTGRIAQLAAWFPEAKFIHMARHPHKLVSSTMRLWKSLDETQSFQLPKYDDDWLKDYVFECQRLMYDSYFQHKHQLPPERLVEVKFEDLVASPQETVARIYDQLGLDGRAEIQANVQKYFDQRKGHKTNPVVLDDLLKAEIDGHWKPYADAFGYGDDIP